MYISYISKILLILGGILLFIHLVDPTLLLVPHLKPFIILVVVATVYNMFNRDFYLPFLGKTAFPLPSNQELKNTSTFIIKNLPPNVTVMFWAAQPQHPTVKTTPEFTKAYGDYKTSGVTQSNEKGEAIIKLPCPGSYTVPAFGFKKTIKPHIHYRYETPEYKGMFSRIYTFSVEDQCAK